MEKITTLSALHKRKSRKESNVIYLLIGGNFRYLPLKRKHVQIKNTPET